MFLVCLLVVAAVAASAAAGVAAGAPRLAIALNQTVFQPGETVEITVAAENPGASFSADLYAGALRPDGAAVFLASLSPLAGAVMPVGSAPASLPALLTDVVVPAAQKVPVLENLSFQVSEAHARGEYSVFAALTRPSALGDGRMDEGELIAGATQPFTVVDAGTGLHTAEIEIDPASPTTTGTVAIRLSGVWPDSCVPHDPRVRVTGSEVRVDTAGAPPGSLCATVLTPWQLTVVVGPLPAGSYRVVVVNVSHGRPLDLGRKAFEVR